MDNPVLIDNPHNHWLFGTKQTKKLLYYIATQALINGRASAEFPLQGIFENIAVKANGSASFAEAIAQELDNLEAFRISTNNPFNKMSFPLTRSNLAESFAIAVLAGEPHDKVEKYLNKAVEGDAKYYFLVAGVCLEQQKKELIKLRKFGYRNWEKYGQDVRDFIISKIPLAAIGQNNKDSTGLLKTATFEGTENNLPGKKLKRLPFYGFECKPEITFGHLHSLHDALVKKGCLPVPLLDQQVTGSATVFAQTPAIWLKSPAQLVYLFTRLAEEIFALPYGIEWPPNALVRETNLSKGKAKKKADQMKIFSSWLNQGLVYFFRDKDGKDIKASQLVNGKKYILKEENDQVYWKAEFEDILRTLDKI